MSLSSTIPGQLNSAAFKFESFIRSGVDPRTGSYSCNLQLNAVSNEAASGAPVSLAVSYDAFNSVNAGLGSGWSINISSYDRKRSKLTLSSGVSYQLLVSGGVATFEDKKLDNLDVSVQGDELVIDYFDGRTEVLSRPDATYDEWLLDRSCNAAGQQTRYEYVWVSGRRRLGQVRNDRYRILSIGYADGRNPPYVTLWPDIREKKLEYLFQLNNENLASIMLVTAEGDQLTWSFQYSLLNGFRVMTQFQQPSGAQEALEYASHGHRLPSGAPVASVPAVIRSTLTPGSAQPIIISEYEYSQKNFLGFDSGRVWSDESDALYSLREAYEYSSTQKVFTFEKGRPEEFSRIVRTYNRFHSMVSQRTVSGDKTQLREIEYYAVPYKTFKEQPAHFQMQRTVRDIYADGLDVEKALATGKGRSETTLTVHDEHGNLLEKTGPSGAREVYEYFPAQGTPDCPASPSDSPRYLKRKTIFASADFDATAPDTEVHYTYAELPSARTGEGRCVQLISETLYEQGATEPLVDSRLTYINDVNSPFHARLAGKTETVGGVATKYRYQYEHEQDCIRTDQVFTAHGQTHRRQTWQDENNSLEMKSSDPSGQVISSQYDSLGRLLSETVMPDSDSSASRQFKYKPFTAREPFVASTVADSSGALTTTYSDGLGRTTRIERQDVDSPGRPMRMIYQASYDALGRLEREIESDWFDGEQKSLETLYGYDRWGHRNLIRRQGQATVHDEVDPIAMTRTQWVEGAGKTRTFNNIFGKPTRVEREDLSGVIREVTLYEYDGLGRCIKQTDPNAAITSYRYDLAGRLISTVLPDGTEIRKKYAAHSQGDFPTEISANDYVLGERTYDALMRITRNTTGGRTEHMRYEGASRTASQKTTAAGNVLNFTLDPEHDDRVIKREGSQAGVAARHRFDPHTGLLQETSNPLLQRRMEYGASGRLKQEHWVSAGVRFQSSSTYSLKGKPILYVDVNGTKRSCRYDNAGRLSGITQGGVNVEYVYNAQTWLGSFTVTNVRTGVSHKTELEYDEFGRETSRRSTPHEGDTLVLTQAYGPGDKLSARTLRIGGILQYRESFTYDLRGRLNHYTCEGEQAPVDTQGKTILSQDYTFDELDNICEVITRFKGGQNKAVYHYGLQDRTQLSAVTHSHPDYLSANATFVYDADGNLLTDSQGRVLAYDELGRLDHVKSMDGQGLAHYQYDSMDRLHTVRSLGEAPCQRFYRDNEWHSEVQSGEGRSIVREGAQVLALLQGQEATLFRTDALGNVVDRLAVENDAAYAYSPYGRRPVSDGLGSLFGLRGEPLDPVTGCYLLGNGYRAYDPVLMRFHRPDSWSPFDGGGLNAYAYCLGDPINFSDPTGHISVWGAFKIGLAAAFAVASVALTVFTLGAAAPLVGVSFSAAAVLTLEVVSGAVSVASAVLEELAPDAVATQVLSYVGYGLTAIAGGVGAGKLLGKGVGTALQRSVDSLGEVNTLRRGNALRGAVRGNLPRATSPVIRSGGPRNLMDLQERLQSALDTKDKIGYASHAFTGIKMVVDRDKYIDTISTFINETFGGSASTGTEAVSEIYGDTRERGRDIRFA